MTNPHACRNSRALETTTLHCVQRYFPKIADRNGEPFCPRPLVQELMIQIVAILVRLVSPRSCASKSCLDFCEDFDNLICNFPWLQNHYLISQVVGSEWSDKCVQSYRQAHDILESRHLALAGPGVELEFLPW